MRVLFELSGEHPTIPLAEAKACLLAENIDFKILNKNSGFLEVEIKDDYKKIVEVGRRLAFSFFVDEIIYSSPPNLDDLISKAPPIEIGGTFRVRCRDKRSKGGSKNINSLKVEQKLGSIYADYGKVDLSNPKVEIRVLLTDRVWYVGKKIYRVDRSLYEKRKVQNRPFFSPISLHPKLARAMVNLSLIRKNEVLLDPFCGTGGVLIEGGLIGAKVIGSDLKEEMVKGCRENLDFYRIKKYILFQSDVGDVPSKIDEVDAVVTDFPYGRATTTNREEIISLYRRAFDSIKKVLKDKKRAVVSVPSMSAVELGSNFFDLREVHPFRVHRSLTRYITVYEK